MATRLDSASFQPTDKVVHPAHGVGGVVSIEETVVEGVTLNCLVIVIEHDRLTVRVPLAKANILGLRRISSPDVLPRVIKILDGTRRVRRVMWSTRTREYQSKLHSGDILSVAEVVRDLHRLPEEAEGQSYSELEIYRKALLRLLGEVAAIRDCGGHEAAAFLSKACTKRIFTYEYTTRSVHEAAPLNPLSAERHRASHHTGARVVSAMDTGHMTANQATEATRSSFEAQAARFNAELAEAHRLRTAAETSLRTANTQVGTLVLEVSGLTTTVAELRSELTSEVALREAAETALQRLEAEVTELQACRRKPRTVYRQPRGGWEEPKARRK